MSDKPIEEQVEKEAELAEEEGELLPNREAMSVLDPSKLNIGPTTPPIIEPLE
jgi:hypothetical protein